jgi:hypothetical protein
MRDGSFVHTLRRNPLQDGVSHSALGSGGDAHGGRDDASLSGIPSGGKVMPAWLHMLGVQKACLYKDMGFLCRIAAQCGNTIHNVGACMCAMSKLKQTCIYTRAPGVSKRAVDSAAFVSTRVS